MPVMLSKSAEQWADMLHISIAELEAIASEYRPQLEGLNILDGLDEWQEFWLYAMMWKCKKEGVRERALEDMPVLQQECGGQD